MPVDQSHAASGDRTRTSGATGHALKTVVGDPYAPAIRDAPCFATVAI
jgi:hypothetical protein